MQPIDLDRVQSEDGVLVRFWKAANDLLMTDMDRELTPFARENGIGLINASAFHVSILTDGGAPDWHPAPREVRDAGRKAFEFCRSSGALISRKWRSASASITLTSPAPS